MATQVTMEDGRESPLEDHLRDAHQKGTRGFTEDYLDTMHRDLHQRKREPEEELEHRHPDAQNAHNQQNAPNARSEGDPYRSDEQPTSGAMTMKQREHSKPRTSESANQHRDRYAQQDPQGADPMRSRESREADEQLVSASGVPGQGSNDAEELQGSAAGDGSAGSRKNGKHNRKNRH